MSQEIMPNVRTGQGRRTLWINNLRVDRHTDLLAWTATEAEGTEMLELTESQTRDLLAKLAAHEADWDERN